LPDKRKLKSRLKENKKVRTRSGLLRIPTQPGVPRKGEPEEEIMIGRGAIPKPPPIIRSPSSKKPSAHARRQPKDKSQSLKLPTITINGMVYTNDSFSIVCRGLAYGLTQNGYKIVIDAWTNGNRSHPIEDVVKKAVKRSSDNKIGIRISHPNSFEVLEHYDYRIGKAYFETDIFPPKWVGFCNKHCDQVWVSSKFNKEVCERSGVENVYIVHDGYDPRIFSPNGEKYDLGFPDDTFVFLTVGNSQKRKGTDLLYRAFTEEFDESEKVGLVYKSYAPWAWGAAKYAKEGRIIHIGDVAEKESGPTLVNADIPYTQMGSLYRAANCFILPTYGEGAGICCVEAMACKVPVITTNWSAQLDYCNNNNSYLIEGIGFEKAFEGMDWQGHWFVPSLDQLKFYMRYVYEHPEMVKLKTEQALIDAKQFTWKECGKEAIKMMSLVFPDVFVEEAIY